MCILSTLILHVYVHTINDKPKWEKTITVYADFLQHINIPYEYMISAILSTTIYTTSYFHSYQKQNHKN